MCLQFVVRGDVSHSVLLGSEYCRSVVTNKLFDVKNGLFTYNIQLCVR